jgi:FKBP-type peptidyl-prolyl cis-trans isomerase FkpA
VFFILKSLKPGLKRWEQLNNLDQERKVFKDMVKFRFVFSFLLFPVFFGSCQVNDKKAPAQSQYEILESLVEVNKNLLKTDTEKINRYMERHNLQMEVSGTGLRYNIIGDGRGEKAQEGQVAEIDYKISLLDGTLCYSSEKKGAEEFLIGMDNVESGIHEGITYMKVGQKAKFILPPHLAHGLIGNQEKIPSRAVIVYDIELLGLR